MTLCHYINSCQASQLMFSKLFQFDHVIFEVSCVFGCLHLHQLSQRALQLVRFNRYGLIRACLVGFQTVVGCLGEGLSSILPCLLIEAFRSNL